MFAVIYRPHHLLKMDQKVFGPYTTLEQAEKQLENLPSIADVPAVKYITDITKQENFIVIQTTPEGIYTATYSGPLAQSIIEACGTATLPTAFTVESDRNDVIAFVQNSNSKFMVL